MTDIIEPTLPESPQAPVMPPPSAEQIAQHYEAMGHSVDLINTYLDTPPENLSEQEVKDAIGRNVAHLSIMLAKDFWTNEDMTEVKKAIAAGTK